MRGIVKAAVFLLVLLSLTSCSAFAPEPTATAEEFVLPLPEGEPLAEW